MGRDRKVKKGLKRFSPF